MLSRSDKPCQNFFPPDVSGKDGKPKRTGVRVASSVLKCPICHSELEAPTSFCPFCGTRLDWTGSSPTQRHGSSHAGAAVGLIVLLVAGGLFATGVLTPAATQFYGDAKNVLRNLLCLDPALCTNSTYPVTTGKATYDQQISLIFSQSFRSLSYNVTAAPQQDSSGFGPAYLLNGLSDSGYWYQVGIAYNWPLASANGYDPGFHFIWEAFTPSGSTNNPTVSRTPDNVNTNDTIGLSLSFQGSNVLLYAIDYNTQASASHTYTAGGGSTFTGSSSSRATRTPTSLMTEWYHAAPSEPTMKQVVYSEGTLAIQSAWICIGEYVPPNPNSLVFAQCSGLLVLTSQMQSFSYHGLNTYVNQYMFQNGPS